MSTITSSVTFSDVGRKDDMRTSTYEEHLRVFLKLYPQHPVVPRSFYESETEKGWMFLPLHYDNGPRAMNVVSFETKAWTELESMKP